MIRKIRDWWRGYSDADVQTMRAKLSGKYKAGEIVWLTPGEMAAMRATAAVFRPDIIGVQG